MARLDVRDLPPAQRHETILSTFEDLDSGETLTLVNDHEPTPLYHQFDAEVPAFDAEGYEVEQEGPQEYVAQLPKE